MFSDDVRVRVRVRARIRVRVRVRITEGYSVRGNPLGGLTLAEQEPMRPTLNDAMKLPSQIVCNIIVESGTA